MEFSARSHAGSCPTAENWQLIGSWDLCIGIYVSYAERYHSIPASVIEDTRALSNSYSFTHFASRALDFQFFQACEKTTYDTE
jgi:hypothetical protein